MIYNNTLQVLMQLSVKYFLVRVTACHKHVHFDMACLGRKIYQGKMYETLFCGSFFVRMWAEKIPSALFIGCPMFEIVRFGQLILIAINADFRSKVSLMSRNITLIWFELQILPSCHFSHLTGSSTIIKLSLRATVSQDYMQQRHL